MPIKSYIVHPKDGKYQELLSALSAIENCEVTPSKNKEIAVIVTDTVTDLDDKNMQTQINEIESLKMLSLVSGFETEK